MFVNGARRVSFVNWAMIETIDHNIKTGATSNNQRMIGDELCPRMRDENAGMTIRSFGRGGAKQLCGSVI
jgi:hypothetical protein